MSAEVRGPGRSRSQTFAFALVLTGAFGTGGGAVWGFVRGLYYLPTLPIAVVEGALLLGVPSFVLGLFVAGLVVLVRPLWAGAR